MNAKSANNKIEISGYEPLYKQVEQRLLKCLANGEWKPGDQLPTESQLAEQFGVAVFTLRAGISELVATNILVRKQGKGTFVARHNRQRQRYQFSHVFRHDGTQLFPDRALLSLTKASVIAEAAEHLGLSKAERNAVLQLSCLLTQSAEPVGTMEIYLPVAKFRSLTARAIEAAQENLYAVYQDVCNINVISIEEKVLASLARSPIARALKIAVGAPVLRVERIAYTYNSVPVEYRVRHFDAQKYHYRFQEGGV